jgi:AraC-like DNA-binding protein
MTNYYKYLPVSAEDKAWGLHVLNVGYNRIERSQVYPSKTHPFHHYFTWKEGRILNEYQLIYISNGAGFFESKSCRLTKISTGTVIMLYPNEWHRFKPDPAVGWDEYWVGCNGSILNNLLARHFLSKKSPLSYIGLPEKVFALFNEIIEIARHEKTGYQPHISGATLHLLGVIHSLMKQAVVKKGKYDDAIQQSLEIIRANINANLSFPEIAGNLHLSYSLFRKLFTSYTGLAPHQYFLQLKLEKARLLLSGEAMSIKEIAAQLGFDNPFYFSKLFKSKWGKSPREFRRSLR